MSNVVVDACKTTIPDCDKCWNPDIECDTCLPDQVLSKDRQACIGQLDPAILLGLSTVHTITRAQSIVRERVVIFELAKIAGLVTPYLKFINCC